MKNQDFMKKLGDFVLGKGFYIVLFLCVATIGISGYYLVQSVVHDTSTITQAGGSAAVTIPDQNVTRPMVPVKPQVKERPTPKPTAPEPAQEQKDDPEPVKQPEKETMSNVFTWPAKGEVLRDYSVETLSFDPTLGDWRTHSGMDIAASEGVQVLSISAGMVSQVYEDDLMGTTVVVDHGGGLQSWYSNLSQETAVAQGDKVEIGSVLGTVGGTAIMEVGMEPHVHLETTLNGNPVDPKDYLEQ